MIAKMVIIGDRSMNPVRGMIERTGAMMGSVIWFSTCDTGFCPERSNHDRMARPMIANCMINRNVSIISKSISVTALHDSLTAG